MSDWEDRPTGTLEEFEAEEHKDPNFFWRIGCGHHQNLLDDALQRIEDAAEMHKGKPCVVCGYDNCKTLKTLRGEM